MAELLTPSIKTKLVAIIYDLTAPLLQRLLHMATRRGINICPEAELSFRSTSRMTFGK